MKSLKIIVSFALTLSLLFCLCASVSAENNPVTVDNPTGILAGDVDNDGEVTAVDALYVLNFSVGRLLLKNSLQKYADVDGAAGITANDALLILQYTVKYIDKLSEGKQVYKKYFTMSFDDGITQDRKITEILRKYNLKATFNINTGLFGVTWNLRPLGVDADHIRVSRDEVKNGLYEGFEVAVHTLTHPNLPSLSDADIIKETKNDAEAITELTGNAPTGMAYPGGSRESYNDHVISLITENTDIRYARTGICTQNFVLPANFMKWDPSSWFNQPDLMDKAREFAQATPENGDMLFYVWGHGYEFDAYNTWEKFEEFCGYMSECTDVVNITNGEVYYVFSE